MSSQPHPKIEPEGINRIVHKDFPESQVDAVLDVLREYGPEDWHREGWRVKAAVLRLADGKLHALRTAMEVAKCDFRDVLVAAEYPEYGRRTSSPARRLEGAERDQVIARDWDQYEAWLKRS
jgi:hypothetical protein